MNRLIFALLCFLLATGVCLADPVRSITILTTTDIHAHLTETEITRLGGILTEARKADPQAVLIDCGDTVIGTYVGHSSRGMVGIQYLNDLGYDFWIPGNHEFDRGLPLLLEQIRAYRGQTLMANLDLKRNRADVAPFRIIERKGVRIAVIGLTYPTLNRFYFADEDFELFDLEPTMDRIMPEVRRAEPDIVILACHYGSNQSDKLLRIAQKYPEIKLIAAGHTHKIIRETLGTDTRVLQPGCHAGGVGRAVIQYDTARKKAVQITTEYISGDAAPKAVASPYRPSAEIRAFNADAERDAGVVIGHTSRRISTRDDSMARFFGEAFLRATGADLALISPPVRDAVFENDITRGDLFSAYPFEQGGVVVVTLTRDELQEIVREQFLSGKPGSQLPYGFSVKRDGKDGAVQLVLPKQQDSYRCAITGRMVRKARGRKSRLFAIINAKSPQPVILESVPKILLDYVKAVYPVPAP